LFAGGIAISLRIDTQANSAFHRCGSVNEW